MSLAGTTSRSRRELRGHRSMPVSRSQLRSARRSALARPGGGAQRARDPQMRRRSPDSLFAYNCSGDKFWRHVTKRGRRMGSDSISCGHLTFPPDFILGAPPATYQIEGGASEGGRGPCFWDTFNPGGLASYSWLNAACLLADSDRSSHSTTGISRRRRKTATAAGGHPRRPSPSRSRQSWWMPPSATRPPCGRRTTSPGTTRLPNTAAAFAADLTRHATALKAARHPRHLARTRRRRTAASSAASRCTNIPCAGHLPRRSRNPEGRRGRSPLRCRSQPHLHPGPTPREQ